MKALIQRVNHASVKVEQNITGKIDKGFLIFLGVGADDSICDVQYLVKKIIGMRIFSDENDKINLSLKDVGGSLLVVSQFTLYADCRKGNRPNFIQAAPPELANQLYESFLTECRKEISIVECGVFGADMKVELENDGPFTIILESPQSKERKEI